MVHWFERLSRLNAFAGATSVLDLGPQDLLIAKPVLFNFLKSVAPDTADDFESRFYENGEPAPMSMIPFYAALGLTDYKSLDLDDARADYRLDLNHPVSLGRSFDVITNFGTLEHLFNPAGLTKCAHDHLKVGGIALHVLPTRGDYNHGFFNVHSTWFRDLAAANKYEVVDMVLVPDLGTQHHRVEIGERKGDSPPRLSRLIDIRDADDTARDRRFAFTITLRQLKWRLLDRRTDTRVYDYIFAAFRKTSDAEFVIPQQAVYARIKEEAARAAKSQ